MEQEVNLHTDQEAIVEERKMPSLDDEPSSEEFNDKIDQDEKRSFINMI